MLFFFKEYRHEIKIEYTKKEYNLNDDLINQGNFSGKYRYLSIQ